ncbi:MAG: hypothetical protein LBP92_03465 [Deltaproteobacteria bacterium]|nr:hypothetical protein [Deltaproteobacteria bacterium]
MLFTSQIEKRVGLGAIAVARQAGARGAPLSPKAAAPKGPASPGQHGVLIASARGTFALRPRKARP